LGSKRINSRVTKAMAIVGQDINKKEVFKSGLWRIEDYKLIKAENLIEFNRFLENV
jgi:hypothetical protein